MNSDEVPWELFESAAGDQKACPGLIVDAAFQYHWMPGGGVMNKLTVADVHAGVSNFFAVTIRKRVSRRAAGLCGLPELRRSRRLVYRHRVA